MLSFPRGIRLEDDRVLLRPLEATDLESLVLFAESEPELWAFSAISPSGREGMTRYVQLTLAQRDAGKEYPFIVYDKQLAACAGSTRFYDIQLDNQSAQLGYTWYGERFQRTGLNRHCKWLLLSYAFESWGMERVEFRADHRNIRSIEAMKAIGCVPEGVLRSVGPSAMGGRRDSAVLSILREEWFGGVRQMLLSKMH